MRRGVRVASSNLARSIRNTFLDQNCISPFLVSVHFGHQGDWKLLQCLLQLKQDFDYAAIQQKSYNNVTLLSELQSETTGDSGANAIGYTNTSVPSVDNTGDMLDYLKTRVDAVNPTTNIYTPTNINK